MKRITILGLVFILIGQGLLFAQKKDSLSNSKSGLIPSGAPVIGFNSDLGFSYGAVIQFYFYGNGERYPRYDHLISAQISRSTKGNTNYILKYDSDNLIKNLRVFGSARYIASQALDFYGFNGYKALYDPDYLDRNNTDYISRMFYRHDRRMLRINADFTGDLINNKLKWFGGVEFSDIRIDTLNIDKLNTGKTEDNMIPGVGGGLFGWYKTWGIIPSDSLDGGSHSLFKVGLIYDTRDNEPNPMKGMWTEVQFMYAPSFASNTNLSYSKLIITHRHYLTIIPKNLNLAFRISYQKRLFGEMPYYMLPFVYTSPPSWTQNGLGGAKTMRGVRLNRVVGEDYLFGNLEARWKFVRFELWEWSIYMALSGFLDAGIVTGEYDIDISNVPEEFIHLFPQTKESLHYGAGGGIHIALNENFVIAFDIGMALADSHDGKRGYYFGFNYLF